MVYLDYLDNLNPSVISALPNKFYTQTVSRTFLHWKERS